MVVPLCGGNIDTPVLGRVIERGLAADGRLVQLTVNVSDRPGGIAGLTETIAEERASIKDIYHERAWLYSNVHSVNCKVVLEVLDEEHGNRVEEALVERFGQGCVRRMEK